MFDLKVLNLRHAPAIITVRSTGPAIVVGCQANPAKLFFATRALGMLAGCKILYDCVASRTGPVPRGFYLNFFIEFWVVDAEDTVPRCFYQKLIGEDAGLAPAQDIRGLVGPGTQTSIAKIAVFAVGVGASDSVALDLFVYFLVAFRAIFLVLFHVVLGELQLELLLLLCGKDSYLFAGVVVPLKIALAAILQLKRTSDLAFSFGDHCFYVGDDACLADVVTAWPLKLLALTEDFIFDVVDNYFADLAQVYFLLSENQHISHCQIELRNFGIIFKFCPLVCQSHLSCFEFFGEVLEDELFELVSCEAGANVYEVLFVCDVDDFYFEEGLVFLGSVDHHFFIQLLLDNKNIYQSLINSEKIRKNGKMEKSL